VTDLTLKAPPGKFRVVGVDTFDRTDWIEGDFDDKVAALNHARLIGRTMLKAHVYDDQGRHVGEAGGF
jgi:hypothetical protein